jgi:RND superfamily putative drug exporter
VERLVGWIIRYRLIVALSWLAITVAGLVIAPSLSGRLVSGTNVSGPGYTANVQIARLYGGATMDPGVLTLSLPAGETVATPGVRTELTAVDAGIAAAAPGVRLVSYVATGSPALIGAGGASTIVLAYPPHDGQGMGPTQVNALTRAAT